ncbi:MAG: hypothetical protein Q8K62_00845 [Thiobacillus sp.]|nr:hypothetical protein [Gallionella sp.]MDP1927035.1 hypothetical protein [Thiobacillus sp.]
MDAKAIVMPERISISYLVVLLVYLTGIQASWMQVCGTLLVQCGIEPAARAIKTVAAPAVFAGVLPIWCIAI